MKLHHEQHVAEAYMFRRVGTTGCEIVSPAGLVIAWTVDEATAAVIVGLLNRVNESGIEL
jgi:hypothetical protein